MIFFSPKTNITDVASKLNFQPNINQQKLICIKFTMYFDKSVFWCIIFILLVNFLTVSDCDIRYYYRRSVNIKNVKQLCQIFITDEIRARFGGKLKIIFYILLRKVVE